MPTLLIVDDDSYIRELVSVVLTQAGFIIKEASDGAEALQQLERWTIDLAILDIMLPGMDGLRLCEEIRQDRDIPILMLTAKAETVHKIKGFDAGADDYLVKPFDTAELVARVKALLKRYRLLTSPTIHVAGLTLHKQSLEIVSNTQTVTLPPKEFEVLFKLAENIGRTILREHLIQSIWGIDFDGNERTLDVHVNRLRDKLVEWNQPARIQTVRGLGYRLEEVLIHE
ncbi:response regulator transcription factor [Paenibacillus sp. GSMTC-2017]|uniref:response regulator transcription factor n=1 Tax=Paenibacillus sp. GSMTC-2017 TaxID=2794350 RepID=UPI0018D6B273|nr:response regulator transcription factor [Paenibacillus sp. GSMTC-2017]MBH5316227.1 response regulator transcription factor [Paenibacillus sp. GSMTC-2017]